MMKRSTFGAILAFLFCAVGALTAAAIYLWRRKKELDEYESLLFSEGDDCGEADAYDEETVYQTIENEPPAPEAEEAEETETAAPAADAPAADAPEAEDDAAEKEQES